MGNKRYLIVKGLSHEKLAAVVNEHLRRDWALLGSPFTAPGGDGRPEFYQALVSDNWAADAVPETPHALAGRTEC